MRYLCQWFAMNNFEGKNLVRACLSVQLWTLMILPVQSQTAQSAQQRAQFVQSHLSRYVIIRGKKSDDLNLDSQMKALGVPAVSIAAIRNGAIDWARAYGVSSNEGKPISTDTLFSAASISPCDIQRRKSEKRWLGSSQFV